jgi:flagellar basal-body rod protein FlgC
MSLFGGMRISASALSVERLRMNVIAENIANAETTRTVEGGPYRRKQVIVAQAAGEEPDRGVGRTGDLPAGGGVQAVGVLQDQSPDRLQYDPSSPDANAAGYVRVPNIDLPLEMVDLMTATRAYEVNATAFATQKQTQERTLELLA